MHQRTTLVSIGLVSEDGREFYAEFTDYDERQVDDWLEEHVLKNLVLFNGFPPTEQTYTGDKRYVHGKLSAWLSQFDHCEMWSDVLAYDWMLFISLFGTAFDLPDNVYYIPFDLATLFKVFGVDPDISREEFALSDGTGAMPDPSRWEKHNALWDAMIIKSCYLKLVGNRA